MRGDELTRVDERSLHSWIDDHAKSLVELAASLIRFDTQALDLVHHEGARNQEGECQAFIRDWLQTTDLAVQAVKPDPDEFREHPMMPRGHHWEGREMTLGCLPGDGEGRSLLFNGHIDVVSVEPQQLWTKDPFCGQVEDGRLYGRGASDMKGGLASALFALKALRACGVRLAGDVWVQAVTDEETSGMGTVAMTKLAPKADAAICPEPTGFSAWVACRGILYGRVELQGRAAHAELRQAHWRAGGGVGAIGKLRLLLEAFERLNEEWRDRPDKQHPLLSTPIVVPTIVEGGEFIATYPSRSVLTFDTTYLPADAGEEGFGSSVRAEVESFVDRYLVSDPWLGEHPPRWEWLMDYPPYEADDVDDLLSILEVAASPLGISVARRGLDSWHDAASLGLFTDTPAISFGPGDVERAHTADESVGVDALSKAAKVFASLLLRWCGNSQESSTTA